MNEQVQLAAVGGGRARTGTNLAPDVYGGGGGGGASATAAGGLGGNGLVLLAPSERASAAAAIDGGPPPTGAEVGRRSRRWQASSSAFGEDTKNDIYAYY